MSEVQNNLGEKFKETITEAMKTGDFHALNTLVTDTVNDALREADFQANLSREATEKKVWNSQRSWQDKRREEVKKVFGEPDSPDADAWKYKKRGFLATFFFDDDGKVTMLSISDIDDEDT